MHLLESYALSAGCKIDKPHIFEKYFPLTVERYITIHTTSKDSKTYDYFDDVLDILLPMLNAAGIAVVQIGGKEDRVARNVFSVCGQTSINQVAYMLKNSLLHLSVDSFSVHIAGAYDKKIVALYSNNYVNAVKPYWGNPENQILLEPDRKGQRPSFALSENPKTINRIKPELIADSVCKLLGLENKYPFKTIAFGNNYKNLVIEGVPNQVVELGGLGIDSMIVRMDFDFNEYFLEGQLMAGKASIVTNKPINIDLLKKHRANILEIVYLIDDNHNPKFVADCINIGVKIGMFTYKDEAFIKQIRLSYMDYGLIHQRPTHDRFADKDPAKLYYKSNKFILSGGAVFPSKAAFLANKPIPNFSANLNPIIDTVDFWREADCFYILEKLDNTQSA